MIDLSNYAVLATVSVSLPPVRRQDKEVTEEVAQTKHADVKHVAALKSLFPKDRLQPLMSAATELRRVHDAYSLPWPLGSGRRMVPLSALQEYQEKVREAKDKFDEEARRFLDNYMTMKLEAQALLGDMFKEEDYPPVDELREKVKAEVLIEPAPSVDRLDDVTQAVLDDATREAMRKALEATHAAAVAQSMASLVDTMVDRLRRVGRYLEGDSKRFKSSLLDTLRHTVNMFSHLPDEVVPDAVREDVAKIKRFLDGHGTPDQIKAIRESDTLREKVATGLSNVASRLEALKEEIGV